MSQHEVEGNERFLIESNVPVSGVCRLILYTRIRQKACHLFQIVSPDGLTEFTVSASGAPNFDSSLFSNSPEVQAAPRGIIDVECQRFFQLSLTA